MNFLIKKTNGLLANKVLGISDFRVAAVLVFVILNLAVFIIRLISVLHYGSLFTDGSDASVIYPVWKGVHNLPVYEWPLAYPFSVTVYNYLFYYTYAFYLKVVGESGSGILTWGSLFTPVFIIVGAIAQWKLVQKLLDLRGARSLLSLFFALGLWSCTSIVRYWACAIRPDVAAVALVMVALCMVIRQPRFGFAYTGVLFYLAWSFKQSVVLALIGVCLFLLFHKRWLDLSVLITVFATLIVATMLLGTPEYRYNILVAPRVMSFFSFQWALQIAPKSILANAYWILAPIALLLSAFTRRVDHAIRVLTSVLVVALLVGLFGMARKGAWDNYLLEAFVAGSTLLQIAIFTVPGRLINALVLLGCMQPAIQVATVPSGAYQHRFGTVGIATAAEYADATALRDRLASMKKPIFSDDRILSLPWYSNDNHAPALIIEPLFHEAMRAKCPNGCIEGMLQKGEIPTVLLPSSGDSYQNSLSQNYKKISEVRYLDRQWSIYALNDGVRGSDSPTGQYSDGAH